MRSFVVTGASGWIAHYMVQALSELVPDAEIVAVYRKTKPLHHAKNIRLVQADENLDELLALLPPSTLVNLSRGETEEDFLLHQKLIALQNARGLRYIYASSFNAVDADISHAHHETDPPASQSDYGKFKARCESELSRTSRRFAIMRFSATHGWAPNREARTQEFLKKIRNGEKVSIHTGVLQNRSFVGDLGQQMAMISATESAEGVFHLGSSDWSDELDFLKRLAAAFGYDPSLVVADKADPCNAVMLMDRFRENFPDYVAPTESETIARVAAQIELQKFRNQK